MRQSALRLATSLSTFLCFMAVAPTTVVAQTRSTVTVHTAVRLPGVVLTPGRYDFRPMFDGSIFVVIRDHDNRFVAYVPTIRASRPIGGAIISLRSPVAGSVPEMATWYPDGGTIGYGFVPQIAGPNALSAGQLANLDKRLSVAEDAVGDAERQLSAAESNRDVIRAERRQAE
jgi:hypothetical protein